MSHNVSTSESGTSRYEGGSVKQMLVDAMNRCRAEIPNTKDPKAQALLETTAEVLGGLVKAYSDFDEGTEKAWQ